MEGVQYYIYVLQLANGGYYIGCTKNIHKRLVSHFRSHGATATKEIKVTSIDRIYTLVDYKINSLYAHSIAEILIACLYADAFGAHLVRGAKHGKGWNDCVSPNSLKIIKSIRALANRTDGIKLLNTLKPYHFENPSYWLGKMSTTPSAFDLFAISQN